MAHPTQTSRPARRTTCSLSRYIISRDSSRGYRDLRDDEEKRNNADETSTSEEEHGIGDSELWTRQHEGSTVCRDESG
jgi:hypothetical protein